MEEKSWCLMVTGERDCAEKRFFSSWTEADYVTVEECEYKRKEAYIEEEDTLTIIVNIVR